MVGGLAFPHAAQAIQIVRRRKLPGKKRRSPETACAITSLTVIQASPAELAAIIRGHWLIEDRLHWVRDMDWDEDRSRVRAASAPRVMATSPSPSCAWPARPASPLSGAVTLVAQTGHYGRS